MCVASSLSHTAPPYCPAGQNGGMLGSIYGAVAESRPQSASKRVYFKLTCTTGDQRQIIRSAGRAEDGETENYVYAIALHTSPK